MIIIIDKCCYLFLSLSFFVFLRIPVDTPSFTDKPSDASLTADIVLSQEKQSLTMLMENVKRLKLFSLESVLRALTHLQQPNIAPDLYLVTNLMHRKF